MSQPTICVTCEARPAVVAPWYPCSGCGRKMCGACRDTWSTGCIGVVPDAWRTGGAIDCPAQLCKACREGIEPGEFRCPDHAANLGVVFTGEDVEAQEAEFEQDRKRRKTEQEDLRAAFGESSERNQRTCSGIDCHAVQSAEEQLAGRWQYCIECDTVWCTDCRVLGMTCGGSEARSSVQHYACYYCLSKNDATRCKHCAGEATSASPEL